MRPGLGRPAKVRPALRRPAEVRPGLGKPAEESWGGLKAWVWRQTQIPGNGSMRARWAF